MLVTSISTDKQYVEIPINNGGIYSENKYRQPQGCCKINTHNLRMYTYYPIA